MQHVEHVEAAPPQLPRVVSLLPSATEILCLVGGRAQLAGRSHECDFPHDVVGVVPILTAAKNQFESSRQMHEAVAEELQSGAGLYTIDQALLKQIDPQVILTQSLCSVCSVDLTLVTAITRGMFPPPRIVSLNPQGLDDVIRDCAVVGDAVGQGAAGAAAAATLRERLQRMRQVVADLGTPELGKVAFLEWLDPIFVGGHWTPELIQIAGGTHPLNVARPGTGAPPSFVVTSEELVAMDPDWVILCPCGLDIPTTEREATVLLKQAWWSQLRAVRQGHVAVVDGNHMFNRPGPRLLDALEFLVGLLHNRWSYIPEDFPWQLWEPPLADVDRTRREEEEAGGGIVEREAAAAAARCRGGRVSCAQGLSIEIEELHADACQAGRSTYSDPSTRYAAWTEDALLAHGACCGNRCRHCPWGHYRVQRRGLTRTNRPTRPLLLRPGDDTKGRQKARDRLTSCPPLGGEGDGDNTARVLLVWQGDEASRQALDFLLQPLQAEEGEAAPRVPAPVTLLVPCHERLMAWGPGRGRDDISAAMDVSLAKQVPLLLVPLTAQGTVLDSSKPSCLDVPTRPCGEVTRSSFGSAGWGATAAAGGSSSNGTGSSKSAPPSCHAVCKHVLLAAQALLGSGGPVSLTLGEGASGLPLCMMEDPLLRAAGSGRSMAAAHGDSWSALVKDLQQSQGSAFNSWHLAEVLPSQQVCISQIPGVIYEGYDD